MSRADIILLDMPWKYAAWSEISGASRSAGKHYSVRPMQVFYDLPILDAASENALLMMWVTYPQFMELDPLVQAWNAQSPKKKMHFQWKTVFNTWAKLTPNWKQNARTILANGVTDAALEEMMVRCFANGNGYYTMANPEILAVYGRGGLKNGVERMDRTVRNFQAVPVEEHSKKPDRFHQLIDKVFPKARKLELFARRHYADPRWTCIGNELSGRDIHVDLEEYITGKSIPTNSLL